MPRATGSFFALEEVETDLLTALSPHLRWLSPGARRDPALSATTPCLTRPASPAVHQALHVVDLLVGAVAAVILPEVLDGGDRQDEEHGGQGQLRLEGIDGWHEVEQGDEHKVDIGQAVELLKEVLGQEGQCRVLGGLEPVAGQDRPLGLVRLGLR